MPHSANNTPDTQNQGAATFRPPTVDQVRVEGFFGPRIDTIATKTAKILFDRCIEAGMLDQVDPDRPNPGLRIPFQHGNSVTTQMFWDSDFGKSIETAAYALFRHRDADLEARVDEVVDAYGRLQQEDGYLNSWYLRIQPGKRWTNLRDTHELYNAGHLIEGAVAYYHATGKRKFLDIMCRYADHIATIFGPDAWQKRGYPGHPEIELALIKLGRATGQQRYFDLARFFVDQRGTAPHYFDQEAKDRGDNPENFHFGTYEYCQAHKPVRDQNTVVGHAVRAAYLYAGMADVAAEFDDETLDPALSALWEHLTEKNLYVTGGFGPSWQNEGLTFNYDLPNETAYAETCAAVALVFWANRMLGRGPDARFADVMERALYNGALTGLSIEGTQFFYDNPLESRGDHHRWTWHRCPCCPPNIARLIASVGTYMYGVADTALAVHLYCAGEANVTLAGTSVKVVQQTRYPADGNVRLTLTPEKATEFTLALRIPSWAQSAGIRVNGTPIDATPHKGYVHIDRLWTPDDEVELMLGMTAELLYAHPAVTPDQGRAAILRGPLVYCLEEVDNGAHLNSVVVRDDVDFETTLIPAFGDLVALAFPAERETGQSDALYTTTPPTRDAVTLRAIPYFAWDNRDDGEMLVWLRREEAIQ
jgi:DUF1680 family protein